jgi:hypothetical protein
MFNLPLSGAMAGQSLLTSANTGTLPGMGINPDEMSLWGKMFGQTNADGTQHMGALAPTINSLTGLGNAYLGMKQYGLAKDALRQSKREFEINHGNQVRMTNAELEARQRNRIAANPNAGYRSVGDYMNEFGVQ